MSKHEPTLGLALSGAAARSSFYIGFLEVLEEQGVEVKIIAAQSGASIVASAFACGKLEHLKEVVFGLNWRKAIDLLQRSPGEGGLYSLSLFEEYVRTHFTLGCRFEDLDTKLVFTCANLNTGEIIPLGMGDLAHAVRATCTVPGLFAPVRWGNFLLIDGGLLSVVPGKLARDAGADVVVGVDAKATRHIFMPSHITLKSWYNAIRNRIRESLPVRLWIGSRQGLSVEGVAMYMDDDVFDEVGRPERIRYILGRSLDLAIEAREQSRLADPLHGCDYIISEGVGRFGDAAAFSIAKQSYADGRRVALANLGKIRDLLNSKLQTTNIN